MTRSEADSEASPNFRTFEDCLSAHIINLLSPASTPHKKRRRPGGRISHKPSNPSQPPSPPSSATADTQDPAELHDFTSFLASTIWPSLPHDLRELTHSDPAPDFTPPLSRGTQEALSALIPPEASDTLQGTFGDDSVASVLGPAFGSYAEAATARPRTDPTLNTRAAAVECELCGRDWVPLTYHHLIPRAAAARAVRRGWHAPERTADVAWLCRACHSMVHRVASNEELARDFYSVERLAARDDVGAFVRWVGSVRWKKR